MARTEGNRMKRNYKFENVAELVFEMKDGITHHIFGTPKRSEFGFESDVFTLWSFKEFERMSEEDKNTRPVAFYMPHSDLKASIEYGFLCIRRGEELLFMEDRNQIKKILSGIDDCLVDFYE